MAQTRFSLLISYIRPHWRAVSLGIFALLIVNAVGVYIPLLIRNIIDKLQVEFSFAALVKKTW